MTAQTSTALPTCVRRARKLPHNLSSEISAQVGRADCRGATPSVAILTVSKLYRLGISERTLPSADELSGTIEHARESLLEDKGDAARTAGAKFAGGRSQCD